MPILPAIPENDPPLLLENFRNIATYNFQGSKFIYDRDSIPTTFHISRSLLALEHVIQCWINDISHFVGRDHIKIKLIVLGDDLRIYDKNTLDSFVSASLYKTMALLTPINRFLRDRNQEQYNYFVSHSPDDRLMPYQTCISLQKIV